MQCSTGTPKPSSYDQSPYSTARAHQHRMSDVAGEVKKLRDWRHQQVLLCHRHLQGLCYHWYLQVLPCPAFNTRSLNPKPGTPPTGFSGAVMLGRSVQTEEPALANSRPLLFRYTNLHFLFINYYSYEVVGFCASGRKEVCLSVPVLARQGRGGHQDPARQTV